MANHEVLSEKQVLFINYLLSFKKLNKNNLPSIRQIGDDLGLSTPSIREQIELARNLGLVHIQPRRGISLKPYRFSPAVSKSLYYAVKSDLENFNQYSELRNKLEKAYFLEAVSVLESSDIEEVISIVASANHKLNGNPVQIPHEEHRSYHLSIYRKIDNIFLKGLLISYWDMYELIGLDTYTDLEYLKIVWKYHDQIIQKISCGNFFQAYELLEEHMDLIYSRHAADKDAIDE